MDIKKIQEEAEKVKKIIDGAYRNPTLDALKKIEEDRKTLLDSAIGQWNNPLIQQSINDYEKLLKSPTIAMAFKTAKEYEQYKQPLISSFEGKRFEEARTTLESFQPLIKDEYSAVQSAIEQIQKTIDNSSIQSSLTKLPNLDFYESSISKAVESISKNENLLESSKKLAGLGKSLARDSIKYKMDEYSKVNAHIVPQDFSKLQIPENPLIGQNKQIIEVGKLQNEMLKDISEQMRLQNDYTDLEIKELEKQNQNIESQIEQKDIEILQNRKATKHTLWVAIASIIISIIVSTISILATYDVFTKEKNENDKDNVELLQVIKGSAKQSTHFIQLTQEIKQTNRLSASQGEKQSQQIQLLIEQNSLLNRLLEQKKSAELENNKRLYQ